MKDKRGRRAWVKVQLADHADAHEAATLVMQWKAQRQAATRIVRAIRLYAALCRGDLSMLQTYFPGLASSAHATTAHRPVLAAPTVTLAVRSDAEDISDALDGLGLDGLDFGA
jgi:hypothetical protein